MKGAMRGMDEEGNHRDMGPNKKRPNDGNDFGSPQKKFVTDPEAVYLKFMVPQASAGSVIGKGGQNISELQKEFNVHIRMSKANDVFPGSDSRVAIMSGKVNCVLDATMVIFKRMTSPSDLFPKNPRPKSVSDKELSVIVPQATAGLIIGKGGSRVKSIQEESNCHINLTQKNEHLPTNERVVTIQNNDTSPDNIEKALRLILDIIKGDPQSSSCLTINYSTVSQHRGGGREEYNEEMYEDYKPYGGRNEGGAGGGGGGGRNWNRRGNGIGAGGNMGGGGGGGGGPGGNDGATASTQSSGFTASGYPPQVHFWCTFAGPAIANGHTPPPHMLEGMKTYLLNSGYSVKAVQEIIAASNLLASYGVLKPGNIAVFNSPQLQISNPFNTMANAGDALANIGNMSASNMNMDGWNSMGMFLKQFQQGTSNRGGFDYDSGFESNYLGGGGSGGMNSNMGGGSGYGKHDPNELKRRF